MLSKIQLICLAGSVAYILIILWSVRQKYMKEAYSMLWLLSGIVLIVFSLWTDCLRLISNLIGIAYPPATLFLIMLGGIVLVLFQYSQVLSRNQERVCRLAQEIALLKEEVKKLQK